MQVQVRGQNLPNIDHLECLGSHDRVGYTLERFIDLPSWQISSQLPGLYIEFNINVNMITSLLAGMHDRCRGKLAHARPSCCSGESIALDTQSYLP